MQHPSFAETDLKPLIIYPLQLTVSDEHRKGQSTYQVTGF